MLVPTQRAGAAPVAIEGLWGGAAPCHPIKGL